MTKKISRKKLLKEPDEFLSRSTSLLNYLSDHKREAIGLFLLLLLIVLVFNTFQFFTQRSEQRAFDLLNQALQRQAALEQQEPPQSVYAAMKPDFDELLNRYGNRTAARMGRVHYANMAFAAGRYEEARTLYTQALKDFEKQPFYRDMMLNSLGHVQQAMEDYNGAVKSFETVIGNTQAPLQSQALFILSRLYDRLGDETKRAAALERLRAEHANSMYIDLIK